jgi:hypothetical protein
VGAQKRAHGTGGLGVFENAVDEPVFAQEFEGLVFVRVFVTVGEHALVNFVGDDGFEDEVPLAAEIVYLLVVEGGGQSWVWAVLTWGRVMAVVVV